jgi:biotin carboxyl carrier protein
MPGTVVKVLAKVGDLVARGQSLLVVEAMKMEIQVSAPAAGRVRAIHAAEGDPCDAGQVLAEVEPAGAAP